MPWWVILTRCYLKQFCLDFGDHSSHFRGRASPEDETVTPVFVVWLSGILKVREHLVDCDAGKVGGQEFRLLLDRKSTRLNSSHSGESRMPSSA